jgi:hypothetical protein
MHISVGDIINYQHTNQWGDLCGNWFDYLCTGAKKTEEGYVYRFTKIGRCSVQQDTYPDLEIKEDDAKTGVKTLFGIIHSYKKTGLQEEYLK